MLADELRLVPEGIGAGMNKAQLNLFLSKIRTEKPNFANLSDKDALTLCGIYKEGKPTLAGLMLFGLYPQSNFPGFDITAVVVPGYHIGNISDDGARFIDNKRIGGTIPELLEGAMSFVHRNIKIKTIIDDKGKRADKQEYPLKAIREIILNALIHRDYSRHTDSSPIRIIFYTDRIEVENPGGLYGRSTLDSLGKSGADTRNPVIAMALEVLIDTENRFSGIPTIRYEMDNAGLPEPMFESSRGVFRATLYNENNVVLSDTRTSDVDLTEKLLRFCANSKSREELSKELNLSSISYMMSRYINPLLETGRLKMTIPDKPKSRNQKYYSE